MRHRRRSKNADIPYPPIAFPNGGGFIVYNGSGYHSSGMATGPKLASVLDMLRSETDFLLMTSFRSDRDKGDNEAEFTRLPGQLTQLVGGRLIYGYWLSALWFEHTNPDQTVGPHAHVEHSWLFTCLNKRASTEEFRTAASKLAQRHAQQGFIYRAAGRTWAYDKRGMDAASLINNAEVESTWLCMAMERAKSSDADQASTSYAIEGVSSSNREPEIRWVQPASISGMMWFAGIGAHRYLTQGLEPPRTQEATKP